MDKLYSKTALATKAVFCVLLAPLYVLISSLLIVEDEFLFILLSVIPIGCLFTVPFWFSLAFIRKYNVYKIGKYILLDSVYCYVPSVLGVLITDIIYTIKDGISNVAGVTTLIFSAIFLIIVSLFWFLYFLYSRKK